jgi:hypothetical protein
VWSTSTQIPSHGPKDRLSCELPPLEAITQTHTDARPIVPPSIIREVRQQQSLQQNLDADWPPRAVAMRVLDAYGREVHSAIRGVGIAEP